MLEILRQNFKMLIIDCIYKTNKYKMFLLIICEIIFLNTIFIVDFVFLDREIKNYYNWMLYHLIHLYSNLKLLSSRVIVIDRNLVLIKVIDNCLSKRAKAWDEETSYVLCLWHLHRNVTKNCKFLLQLIKNKRRFWSFNMRLSILKLRLFSRLHECK